MQHQRVGLSLKRLKPNPWATVESHFKPGDVVTGSIASVERFGVFVELMVGIEGLLHISELREASCAEDLYARYAPGEPITVRIADITPTEHRIALSMTSTTKPYAAA